jgi:hypothetical protein
MACIVTTVLVTTKQPGPAAESMNLIQYIGYAMGLATRELGLILCRGRDFSLPYNVQTGT